MTDETFPHEIWADLDHWIEGPAASDLRAQGYMKYIRSDHVADMLKAEREKALREALTACDKALSDMQAANPNRHDALPYIEDGCEACKDAIEALISEDKTDG